MSHTKFELEAGNGDVLNVRLGRTVLSNVKSVEVYKDNSLLVEFMSDRFHFIINKEQQDVQVTVCALEDDD